MKQYVVLYRTKEQWLLASPRAFVCQSANVDEAEDQCVEAHPGCDIVWAHAGSEESALEDYYDWGGEPI